MKRNEIFLGTRGALSCWDDDVARTFESDHPRWPSTPTSTQPAVPPYVPMPKFDLPGGTLACELRVRGHLSV
jgi:hypothetical protein